MAANKFKEIIDGINKDTGSVEVDFQGSKVRVKKYLTIQESVDYTRTVLQYMEAADLDEMYGVILRHIKKIAAVTFYTDIRLPREQDKAIKFIEETGIFDIVFDNIDKDYYFNTDNAIDDVLSAKYDKPRKSEFNSILTKISNVLDAFSAVDADEIKKLVNTANSFDVNELAKRFVAEKYGEK